MTYFFHSILLAFLIASNNPSATNYRKLAPQSIYDLQIQSLDGNLVNLSSFQGKKILFVNVASKCGFTKQYAGLQELHQLYKEKLVIIGLPCNQFMNQEPGTNEEIASFCERNYGVEFLITEKIDVKGDKQHPIYQWLTQKEKNGVDDSKVTWNFQKYLISEDGVLLKKFAPNVEPLSSEITNALD